MYIIIYTPIRSVGGFFSPSCPPALRQRRSVQVFIPQELPRGARTHGKRLAAQAQTTQEYRQ